MAVNNVHIVGSSVDLVLLLLLLTDKQFLHCSDDDRQWNSAGYSVCTVVLLSFSESSVAIATATSHL